ncbi:MAG: 50S ribosomal protein L25 [bacterium]
MEKLTIEATVRENNLSSKRLRKDGKVPAILYGKETKSQPIEIKIKDIQKTVKKVNEGSLLITLKLIDNNKSEEKIVVIREVQRDPVTDEIIHADFNQISEKEKSLFKIPLSFTGTSQGVKDGGVMEFIHRKISVRCLPADLPEAITIDTTPYKIGQDFSIKDLVLGAKVEIMQAPKTVIFTVLAPQKHETEVVAAVPEAAAQQPDVIKKERAEGEEGAEAAPAAGAKGAPAAAGAKGAPAAAKPEAKKDAKK